MTPVDTSATDIQSTRRVTVHRRCCLAPVLARPSVFRSFFSVEETMFWEFHGTNFIILCTVRDLVRSAESPGLSRSSPGAIQYRGGCKRGDSPTISILIISVTDSGKLARMVQASVPNFEIQKRVLVKTRACGHVKKHDTFEGPHITMKPAYFRGNHFQGNGALLRIRCCPLEWQQLSSSL